MEYVAKYGIRRHRDLPSNSTTIKINGILIDRANYTNEEDFRQEAKEVNERTKAPRQNGYQEYDRRREQTNDRYAQLVF